MADVVKIFIIAFAACSVIACAYSSPEGSVYDYPTGKYTGNGGSTSAPDTPSGGERDAAACSVSTSASVSGASFTARDAIEMFDSTKARFTFLISDYADACSYEGDAHASSHVISISYDATKLVSGTYDVASTPNMVVKEITYDASCKPTVTVTAQSGSVVFEKLDDCGGSGTFDLVLGSSKVTGSFTASVCAIPSGVAASCK